MVSPYSLWLYFPSFSEGLSLRGDNLRLERERPLFPFLFGGTFIEGQRHISNQRIDQLFPFLFGGTFIEGVSCGLEKSQVEISLPFRRDFH